MLPTPNQIKAARAMLDWSAEELSNRVGVAKTTISAIETGRSKGSIELLSSIHIALQEGGIEFTNDGGIRPKQTKIITYQGREGFKAFYEDVYHVACTHENPDICLTSSDLTTHEHWLEDFKIIQVERMKKLKNVRPRVLLKEEDDNPYRAEYCVYRISRQDQYTNVPLYIYGDKTAFIEFFEHDVIVTVINHKDMTDNLRKLFEMSWEIATKA